MTYRIAINGFGRIGRDYLRCLLDRGLFGRGFEVVGINDLWRTDALAHLLGYDSTFRALRWDVSHDDASLTVAGAHIPVFREPKPDRLPWAEHDVDLVIESTGRWRSRQDAANHLKAGARRVVITAPGKDVDATIVLGVNDQEYDPLAHLIVSAASCTTNCAAPLVQVLHQAFGVVRGYLPPPTFPTVPSGPPAEFGRL